MDDTQKQRFAELLAKERKRPIEKFQDNTREYLGSILQKYNVPDYVVMEIAGHITVQTYIFTADQINVALKRYERGMKQRFKHQTKEGVEMTEVEFAKILNGREYGLEMTPDEERQAEELGLVVVFGYSDDNAEFRGAIDDEIGCYDGGRVFERGDKYIDAKWCDGEYSWMYDTNIPHAVFDIYEDGEKFCRGIVFKESELLK